MARLKKLTISTLYLGIGLGMLTGCNAEKKPVTPPTTKPPEQTQYTPKEDGDWLNVADVYSFKKNITLEFVKFGDWIGASWFRMIGMRRGGYLHRPADAVYDVVLDKEGRNPSIEYGCQKQMIRFVWGSAMDGITKRNKDTVHYTWRFDGGKHFSELAWQTYPRETKGINPATGEFKEPPKGVPKNYAEDQKEGMWEKSNNPVWSNLYTATTIEMSVVDNPKDIKEGVYARWNLPKSLKEMQASGELDRACKALIGADYITVGMVEQQAKAEKKAEELKAKQDKAKALEKDNAKKKD